MVRFSPEAALLLEKRRSNCEEDESLLYLCMQLSVIGKRSSTGHSSMAAIFPSSVSPAALNASSKQTLVEHLGIEFIEVGADFLRARMPVDQRTKQPYGLLHGGASAVLSETLGSVAATLCVDLNSQVPVGLELNANHIRSVSTGYVYGTVRPIHVGRSTHVWETRIEDEAGQLVCVSRLTILIKGRG
jgi:uncharacterized protein (TIGR00369 family)